MSRPIERKELMSALLTMPDEAFSWLLLTIAGHMGRGQVWPDGLGGFGKDSQASITRVIAEAQKLLAQ